ncbi:phosphatase PAP2 family protein [Tellurirhabdus rosea]|uniref:phosphatase PAP2 family protein n=1 Tax=Tellurirhabdus rosea TaxID=2674997 RepID=UPI00225A5582|nr:phosphatase PAP2 family protein [Tellurirhabdus rosea]
MNTPLARFLSVVFHPLLIPTLLFGLLLIGVPGAVGADTFSLRVRLNLLVLIALGTFLLPALLITLLHRAGYVRSLHMEELTDRRVPYFLTAVLYTTLTLLFTFRLEQLATIAPGIGIILASVTVSVTLVGLISIFWKISAHSVSMSGMIGALLGITIQQGEDRLFFPLLVLVALTGMVGTARLYLNAHTPAQVWAGYGLGLAVGLACTLGL